VRNVRILLVDDTRIVRRSVAELLNLARDLELVAETDDGRAAVRLAVKLQPDIVLLGLTAPEEISRVIREMSALCPSVRTIVFATYDAEPMRMSFGIARNAVYTMQLRDVDALLPAIRTVAARHRCARPDAQPSGWQRLASSARFRSPC
jgi:two-component system response regulator NreC